MAEETKYPLKASAAQVDAAISKVISTGESPIATEAYVQQQIGTIPTGGGGEAVTVDQTLNQQSSNPVANKAVAAAISDLQTKTNGIPTKTSDLQNNSGYLTASALTPYATKEYAEGLVSGLSPSGETVAVDSTLSTSSNNAIANKAVAVALADRVTLAQFGKATPSGVASGVDCSGIINALITTYGGKKPIYLPDLGFAYTVGSPILVNKDNTVLICDGTIQYTGASGAAIRVSANGTEVKVRKVVSANDALSVVSADQGRFYIGYINAEHDGISLVNSADGAGIQYCVFDYESIIAKNCCIYCSCTAKWQNETYFGLSSGGRLGGTSIKAQYAFWGDNAGAFKLSGSFEGSNIGAYIKDSKVFDIQNVRTEESTTSYLYQFVGNCAGTLHVRRLHIDRVNVDELNIGGNQQLVIDGPIQSLNGEVFADKAVYQRGHVQFVLNSPRYRNFNASTDSEINVTLDKTGKWDIFNFVRSPTNGTTFVLDPQYFGLYGITDFYVLVYNAVKVTYNGTTIYEITSRDDNVYGRVVHFRYFDNNETTMKANVKNNYGWQYTTLQRDIPVAASSGGSSVDLSQYAKKSEVPTVSDIVAALPKYNGGVS